MKDIFVTAETVEGRVKLKAPISKGRGKGAKVDPLSSEIPVSRFEEMT